MSEHAIVSSPSEQLILVDSTDREIGTMSKSACHEGDGTLHRAFSVFLFNADGDVLMQKRSELKPLWPGFWSNSCCSHPRHGETMAEAVDRRVSEELGVRADLSFLYKFEYQARYEDVGSENELCHVYLGRHDGPFAPNRSEVDDLRFFSQAELASAIETGSEPLTPWFLMEWREIKTRLPDGPEQLISKAI